MLALRIRHTIKALCVPVSLSDSVAGNSAHDISTDGLERIVWRSIARMAMGWILMCMLIEVVPAAEPEISVGPVSETYPVTKPTQDSTNEWRVMVSPYVWAASLNGSSALGPFNVPMRVPFSTLFRNLDFTAMGNIEISRGPWGGYFDAQYTKVSRDIDVEGRPANVGSKTTMLSAGLFYRAFEQTLGGQTVFGEPRKWALEPTIGLRWSQLTAFASPLAASRSVNWIDPIVGIRAQGDLTDRWNIAAESDIGGFGAGSRFSTNAQLYFGYRTYVLSLPTILRVGYRVLYQNYHNDSGPGEFDWKVTEHGPVIGLSMIF